jgi:hypothetical protein
VTRAAKLIQPERWNLVFVWLTSKPYLTDCGKVAGAPPKPKDERVAFAEFSSAYRGQLSQ